MLEDGVWCAIIVCTEPNIDPYSSAKHTIDLLDSYWWGDMCDMLKKRALPGGVFQKFIIVTANLLQSTTVQKVQLPDYAVQKLPLVTDALPYSQLLKDME